MTSDCFTAHENKQMVVLPEDVVEVELHELEHAERIALLYPLTPASIQRSGCSIPILPLNESAPLPPPPPSTPHDCETSATFSLPFSQKLPDVHVDDRLRMSTGRKSSLKRRSASAPASPPGSHAHVHFNSYSEEVIFGAAEKPESVPMAHRNRTKEPTGDVNHAGLAGAGNEDDGSWAFFLRLARSPSQTRERRKSMSSHV
ncbi:hypothetical protein BT69DRAFT_1315337 [Atractiella rhizophila]|nr:hypothetical protein BT69DRAFT_1315337 [Atractiella rhizophila]